MDPTKNASINVENDLNMHTMEQSGHKRGRQDDAVGSPEDIVYRTAVRKDRAVANYYKRLTINNDIQFFQEMLLVENLGEAMKRNIKNKLNNLLAKKIEDRYDDVNM